MPTATAASLSSRPRPPRTAARRFPSRHCRGRGDEHSLRGHRAWASWRQRVRERSSKREAPAWRGNPVSRPSRSSTAHPSEPSRPAASAVRPGRPEDLGIPPPPAENGVARGEGAEGLSRHPEQPFGTPEHRLPLVGADQGGTLGAVGPWPRTSSGRPSPRRSPTSPPPAAPRCRRRDGIRAECPRPDKSRLIAAG